ncbi:MAG TPA: hypothetical protein PLJ97_00735 [Candidatus Saccharibacteria bacterium]|nr:hypothetical protein [Candidatus Saccharibacteria bacterium]
MNPNQRRLKSTTKYLFIAFIFVLLATAGYLYKNQKPDYNDVKKVKRQVGQMVLLPEDEEPALATVTDSSKLTSSLAAKAQNGDKVLIYQRHQRAILYRPSVNRIVDIVPVQIDSVQSLQKNVR